jgi:hypothetical protein
MKTDGVNGLEEVMRTTHEMFSKKFGDYIIHGAEFGDLPALLAYTQALSFAKGKTLEALWFPRNLHCVVQHHAHSFYLILGGQPTANQNYEILSAADRLGIPLRNILHTKEHAPVRREFNSAQQRLKGEKPETAN